MHHDLTKRIAIITGGNATKNRLVLQLEKILEHHAQIQGYAVSEGIENRINADFYVFSSPSLQQEVAQFLDPSIPRIIARRAVDSTHIDQLFALRKGTVVLLVNDSEEATLESIELLRLLGMDYLNYLPWYPEMDAIDKTVNQKQCHVAITLGEADLVPIDMLEVIDLGPRIIDLSTIVEILHQLNLLDEKSHYLSATYFGTIVKLGRTIHRAMEEQEQLNDKLQQVLHQIHDGLFAYDHSGAIRVFSQKCELIFGVRSERAIGKSLTQIIRQDDLLKILKSPMTLGEAEIQSVKIGDHTYQVRRFSSGKGEWMVCTLRDLSEQGNKALLKRRHNLEKGHVAKYGFEHIIHQSEIMKNVIHTAKKIAKTQLAILIYGESGTGKELFASAIHRASEVAEGPFLAVNFSALPEELVESELFGYEEGAFTGAKKGGRPGLFEQANGGTLFLDEIGDISLKMQTRLLRVLQEKEVMRVGGSEIIPVEVRIIAATNKSLLALCEQGLFREELYYRLKRLSLYLPPLRDRREDIPSLVDVFLQKNGWSPDAEKMVSLALIEKLKTNDWPGNVRELESIVEYLVAVADCHTLDVCNLPLDFIMGKNDENVGLKGGIAPKTDVHTPHIIPKWMRLDYYFLLECIKVANREGKSIGRDKLSELSQTSGLNLTADRVRSRIKDLEKNGFIDVEKGRKGPQITELGLDLYEKMKQAFSK